MEEGCVVYANLSDQKDRKISARHGEYISTGMKISPQFMIVGAPPNGYSVGKIRRDIDCWSVEIENMFGPSTDVYSLRGIEFCAGEDEPHVFYPYDYPGEIILRLVGRALTEQPFARFQLSHELVHCLSPSGRQNALVLEEGMAAWYQERLSKKELNSFVRLSDPRYVKARAAFAKAYKKDHDFIVKLRRFHPNMWEIVKDDIDEIGLKIDDDLKSILTTPFCDFMPTNGR